MERMYGPGQKIPPMFSPTATTIHLDIPWPDFAFFPPIGRNGIPHPLRTPRWDKVRAPCAHQDVRSLATAGRELVLFVSTRLPSCECARVRMRARLLLAGRVACVCVQAHPELLAIGRSVKWEDKIGLGVFTGNMMGKLRQELYSLAEKQPDILFVNEARGQHRMHCLKSTVSATPTAIPGQSLAHESPQGRAYERRRALEEVRPVVQGALPLQVRRRAILLLVDSLSRLNAFCPRRQIVACRVRSGTCGRYLLNVGSNGYANKLRYLFLCGSVVIWVRTGSLNHEFFERQVTLDLGQLLVCDN
eukprot:6192120-Pleurochrysis_carterae.AAC.1